MSRTQYFVASSIDGYIADASGSLDWLLQFDGMDGAQESYERFLAHVGAILMGAETYRFLLSAKLPAWPYPGIPTWVFSSAPLPPFGSGDIRHASGAVQPVHELALRSAGDRNVWMVGGGKLAAQFANAGLLDDLLLTVIPVILGSGRPLLPLASGTAPLELTGTTILGRGAVELRYRLPPGPPSTVSPVPTSK